MVGDVTSKGVGIEYIKSSLVDDVVLRGDKKTEKGYNKNDAKNMFSDRLESFSYPFWAGSNNA